MTTARRSGTRPGPAWRAATALLAALAASLLACSDASDTGSPAAADRDREATSEAPGATAGTPKTGQGASRRQPAEVSPPFLEANISAMHDKVVVALHQPETIFGALPTQAEVKLGPDGSVFYRYLGDLHRMVADPVFRDSDGSWSHPEEPEANDEWLSTPACQGLMEGFDNPDAVRFFWIDPDGRVAYTCPQQREQPMLHYVDGPSVEMGKGVIHALGTESRTLGRGGRWDDWGIDDQGTFIPVERAGTPWARSDPGAMLADRDGFLVVFLNPASSWDEDGLGTLHRLYYDGQVEQIGEYGPPPETVSGGHRYLTLAPGGILYLVHSRQEDVVFRFDPDFADPGEVLYRAPNKRRRVSWVARWSSG